MNIIIGAGLTGLSLAHQLKKRGEKYMVFEKNGEVGGTSRSFQVDGEWFDYGIHVVNTLHPLIKVPMQKYNRVAKIHITCNIVLDYPYQMNKGRVNNELQSIPANYYDYLLLKYGKDAFDFHIPYAEKFWNCDLRTMDWKWTTQYAPQGKGVNNEFYYPKHGGIGEIAKKLSKGIDIIYNTRVEYINIVDKIVCTSNGYIEYDKIYNTCPIPELRFVKKIDVVQQAINRLKYTSMKFDHTYAMYRLEKNNKWSDQIHNNEKNIAPYHWSYSMGKEYIRMSYAFNSEYKAKEQHEIIVNNIDYNIDNIKNTRYLKYAYCVPTLTLEDDLRIINGYMENYGIYNRGRFGRWKNLFMHESLNETL
jgi:predicted NAD/FAD-dependent oxidoreductase